MSGDQQARLFAAVELPGEVTPRLVAWAREAARSLGSGRARAGLRVLEADSLHLTLCFLGSRPAAEIDELVDAMAAACADSVALELFLGAPVWLPPRRPRALTVEVHEDSGELGRLQAAVQRTLMVPGEPAGRPHRYRPHVTVARAGAGFRPPAQAALPVTPSVVFDAVTVSLMRSWLDPQGARYESQGSVRLLPVRI